MKKQTKRFLAKIMTIVMLCSLITFPVNATGDGSVTNGQVTINKLATQRNEALRQSTVELRVEGIQTTQKADVILVLDTSTSMDYNGSNNQTRLENLQAAVKSFVGTFLPAGTNNRVAVVSYNENAVVNLGFTSNATTVINTVNNLDTNDYTNMQAGMLLAQGMLAKADPAAQKSVIFMSDGDPNTCYKTNKVSVITDPKDASKCKLSLGSNPFDYSYNASSAMISVANAIKTAGPKIYSVGFGVGAGSNGENTMKAACSTPSSTYYASASDSARLTAVFQSISQRVVAIGQEALVTDIVPAEFIASGFSINGNAVTPGNGTNLIYANGTITWKPDAITPQRQTLTYMVQAQAPYCGSIYTNESATLKYKFVDSNGATAPSFTSMTFPRPFTLVKPYAAPDSYSVKYGVEYTNNVTVNDINTIKKDGRDITGPTVHLVTGPNPNTVDSFKLNSDGSFTYKAKRTAEATSDSFTYCLDLDAPVGVTSNTLHSGTTTVTINLSKPVWGLTTKTEGGSADCIIKVKPIETTYNDMQTVELEAVAGTGYDFVQWKDGATGSDAKYTLTMDGQKNVIAVFQKKQFVLTVNASGGTVEQVNPPALGKYPYDTPATVKVVKPDTGYHFVKWSCDDGSEGTDPAGFTVNMTKNKTVTATFEKDIVKLTPHIIGNGTITPSPSGPYLYGDKITLQADALGTDVFTGWSGDVSGNAQSVELVMDGDKDVTATFASTHKLDTAVVGGGAGDAEITRDHEGNPTRYIHDDVVVLTAVNKDPANNTFKGFEVSKDGLTYVSLATANDSNITAGDAENIISVKMACDYYIRANFVTLQTLSTSVKAGTGNVLIPAHTGNYEPADVVTVTADPAKGYEFDKWDGDYPEGSEHSAAINVTMDKNITLGAYFKVIWHHLTVNQDGLGTYTVSEDRDSRDYTYFESVTLVATPDISTDFVGWYSGTTLIQKSETLVLAMTEDRNVTAKFVTKDVDLTVGTSGNGKVAGGLTGTYKYGQTIDLSATPDEGWLFETWKLADGFSGNLTSNANGTGTIKMDGNQKVIAVFVPTYHALGVEKVNCTVGVNATAPANEDGEYAYDTVVTLTPTANPGYEFASWSGLGKGDSVDSTTHVATITMNGAKNVKVEYKRIMHTLTINSDNGTVNVTGVTFAPNGQYSLPSDITYVLTPQPKANYHFVKWEGEYDQPLPNTGEQAAVTLTADKAVSAVFEINSFALATKVTGKGHINGPEIIENDSSEEDGSGHMNDDGTFTYGTLVKLNAVADPDWHFVRWAGGAVGTENPLTLNMNKNYSKSDESDLTVIAVFEQDIHYYPLNVSVVGQGSYSTSVAPIEGKYTEGTPVQLIATPASGWQFAGWSGDQNSSNASFTVTMNGTVNLTATFTEIPAPPVTPPSGPTVERDKADPPVTNIPQERAPLGLPAVPAVKEEPVVALPEEVIPMGVPVLPKTGETSSLFFYLLGLGLVGAGVLGFRKKEMN